MVTVEPVKRVNAGVTSTRGAAATLFQLPRGEASAKQKSLADKEAGERIEF